MPIAAYLAWISGVPLLIGTYYYYDRLVRMLHDVYHDLWIELGRPVGWLWSPGGWRQGLLSQHPLFWTVTFGNAAWSQGKPDLTAGVWRYRLCYYGFCVSVVASIALGFSTP